MLKIRPMVQSDLPDVLTVVATGWGKAHAQAGQPDFNEMFGSGAWRPFFYVAQYYDTVIGVAGYGVSWLNYGVYDLFWVGVHKDHRNRGVGRSLINACLRDLRPIADQVILATDIPEFYTKKFGFVTMCPLPTTQGPDDVLMALSLNSGDEKPWTDRG